MSNLASKVQKLLEETSNREEGVTGVPSGFTDLDKLTSGFQPSDLVILAARPAMGGSSSSATGGRRSRTTTGSTWAGGARIRLPSM